MDCKIQVNYGCNCQVSLEELTRFFPSAVTYVAIHLDFIQKYRDDCLFPFRFVESESLKSSNPTISTLEVGSQGNMVGTIAAEQLSLLLQHFNLTDDNPSSSESVDTLIKFNYIREVWRPFRHEGGLYLRNIDLREENSTLGSLEKSNKTTNMSDTDNSRPQPLQNVKKILIESDYLHTSTIPEALTRYKWPNLENLTVVCMVFNANASDFLALQSNAPKLRYFRMYAQYCDGMDAVWAVDWEALPWPTQFVARCETAGRSMNERWSHVFVDLRAKFTEIGPPNTNFVFYDDFKTIHVDLSQNELTSLGKFNFSCDINPNHNCYLQLNLSHNHLVRVALRDMLPEYSIVHVLDLSFNQLQDVGSDFLLFPDIQKLYLHHNNYTVSPAILYRRDRGSQGAFHFSEDIAFTLQDMQQLRLLDMSFNAIVDLSLPRLDWDRRLQKLNLTALPLEHVNLRGNKLTEIPDFVFSVETLRNVDLSDNQIETLCAAHPRQRTAPIHIDLTNNPTSSVMDPQLWSEANRSCSAWNSSYFLESYHFELISLDCSQKRNAEAFEYLVSSARSTGDTTLDRLPDFSFYRTQWKCTSPQQWAGIPLMQIPEYQFRRRFPRYTPRHLDICGEHCGCPDGCFCYHSRRMGDILVANCTPTTQAPFKHLPVVRNSSGISYATFAHNEISEFCLPSGQAGGLVDFLEDLTVLDFSWNVLNKICPDILHHLSNLRTLNLTHNHLKSIPPEIESLQNVTTIILSDNQLDTLPKCVKRLHNLREIDLSTNLFRCDCDTFWMAGWFIASAATIANPQGIVCFSGNGRGRRLIGLSENAVGCYTLQRNLIIATGVTVPLLALAAVLVYRYRKHIKIWLYSRFGFHPWDKVKENPEDKDYDAFVSYSQKDEAWVLKTLLPYLEAPQLGFHLCVHLRDFVPGATISTNIMTAIQYSRRVILVLSPDFIKSGWCDLEFQAAHRRALEDRSNFLIVVLLHPVQHKDLDSTLQLYMKTRTYIDAKDGWFWQKIIYALPETPIDKLKAQLLPQNSTESEAPTHTEGQERRGRNGGSDDGYQLSSMQESEPIAVRVQRDETSSDNDSDSDSDEPVSIAHKPYERKTIQQYVAELPPLFRRLNTYNRVLSTASETQ